VKKIYILFIICVILLLGAGCSNSDMLIDGEITESETTEEYYGGNPDFRLTRMIAENYLMENMEHYDWKGAVIGDFYPLYNPATDKITYLEYKVTKDGADRGYILVTLKDDETGVVESSHGENGTCYELLRDRAGTGEIKAYRFSFASYVAESKTATRAGGRKILAALGNIEYELNDAINGGETLSRSRGAVDKYKELIRSYRDRTAENGGYLDIKKEYGEYLKKRKEDKTRTAPTHKEDKTAEIQWYWDETTISNYYSSVSCKVGGNWGGIGGVYTIRCHFLNGTYQDITFSLSTTTNINVKLNRSDLLRIESKSINGYMYGDATIKIYLGTGSMIYSFKSSNIPPTGSVLWQNATTRIHYPLMRANQFFLSDGVTPCGCVPVAGAMIAAYWDKIKGIDMYPGTPTDQSGTSKFNPYPDFRNCVNRFRYYLGMNSSNNSSWTTWLGNAFYWYGVERGLFNPCSYEILYNIDGIAVEYPQSWGNLDEYTYDRLIYCLSRDWPVALGYTELSKDGHSAVIYKALVKMDSYNNYYNSILSVDTGWWDPMLKDLNNVTYGLKYVTLIWR